MKSGASAQRGLRNKPMRDRNLMKQSGGSLKTRRGKRGREEDDRRQDEGEAADEDVSAKRREPGEKKEKKNTRKP